MKNLFQKAAEKIGLRTRRGGNGAGEFRTATGQIIKILPQPRNVAGQGSFDPDSFEFGGMPSYGKTLAADAIPDGLTPQQSIEATAYAAITLDAPLKTHPPLRLKPGRSA